MNEDQEILNSFKQADTSDEQIRGAFKRDISNLPPLARKEYARSIASLNKVADPSRTTSESYQMGVNSRDPIGMRRDTLGSAIVSANEQGAAMARDALSSVDSVDQGVEIVRRVEQQNKERESLMNDPFGPEKMEAYAEAYPNATESQLQEYALNTAMQQDLSRMASDIGIGETVWDMAKMFVPGRMSWNLGGLVGDTPVVDAWNAESKLTNLIDTWNSLPVERRQNMWPYLKKQVIDQMGPTDGLNILSKFLDPAGREATGDYSNAWVGMDMADLATGVTSVAVGIGSWLNRANKVRRLGELGNKEGAAEATTKVLVDETGQAAEEVGIERVTAANNAEPMKSVEGIDPAAFTGASAETQTRLVRIQQDVRKSMENIRSETPVISPFSGTTNDVVKAINAREAKFQEIYPNYEMTDIITRPLGNNSFETSGTVFDATTGAKIPIRSKWNMTLNDNGEYVDTLKHSSYKLNSPKYVLRGNKLATEELNKAVHAETVSADMLNKLSDQFMRGHKLLKGNPFTKKKKREAVDRILEEGDEWADDLGNEIGHNFSYTELRDRGLEADQIEYYYAMRQFSDSLFELHNDMTRNRMVLNNVKNLSIPYGKNNLKAYGKVYDSPNAARASLRTGNSKGADSMVNQVLDTRDGKIKSVDNIDWEDVYDKGGRLARAEDQTLIGPDSTRYNVVILDSKGISELPARVMRNKPGYLSRSYERGVYANTLVKKGMLNGQANRIVERKTLRLYDNQYEQADDIDGLIEDMRAKGYDVGREDSDAEWQLVSTDPKEPLQYSSVAEAAGGRMYTSPRASRAIPFGSKAEKAERTSPVKSIQRQLGHLAVHYPRHQQRMAMADRIQKFADARRIPFDFHRPVEGSKDEHKFLEEMRKNYLEWASHKTQDEAWAAQRMRSYYESLVGQKGFDRSSLKARAAWHLINASPIQRIRTANFHLLLGVFNPVQLWIQAQGGLVAASVLPVSRANKVARGMPALATAMNTRDDVQGAKLMARALGVSDEEGARVLRAYHDTGFDNSVRANADIQQVENNMADPLAVFKKLGKHDTIFYAMGERFNRRLSWTVSLEKYMANNKIGSYSKLTDSDWNKIRDNANTFMLTMHSANKARWQKGVLSIPTQFLQVQAKFVEEMLNLDNGLSAADRARIALTQVLLYGSVGIPFVGDDAANALGQMIGMDEAEVQESPALHGGAMQVMFNSMGIESSVSARTAILGGLEDLWGSILGDESTAELMAGPASSTGARAMSSLFEFSATAVGLAGQGNFDPSIYGKAALESLARLSSTYSQIEKYQLIKNNQNAVVDKYGQRVDYVNDQTALAQLFGLTPNAQEKMWDIRQKIAAQKNLERKGEELLFEGWNMLSRANTERGKEQANAYIWTVLNSYYDDPLKRQEVLTKLWQNVNNPQTELEKTMHRWYKDKQAEAMRDLEPSSENEE